MSLVYKSIFIFKYLAGIMINFIEVNVTRMGKPVQLIIVKSMKKVPGKHRAYYIIV